MKKTLHRFGGFRAAVGLALLGVGGFASTSISQNGARVSDVPDANPVPADSSQIITASVPAAVTGATVVVVVPTNTVTQTNIVSVPASPTRLVPRIDTSRLVREFTGTDAGTKQKIATAIADIRAGDTREAAALLRNVEALTKMTPDQQRALDEVLDQLQ